MKASLINITQRANLSIVIVLFLSSLASAANQPDNKCVGVVERQTGTWREILATGKYRSVSEWDAVFSGSRLEASQESDEIEVRLIDQTVVKRFGNSQKRIPIALAGQPGNVELWQRAFILLVKSPHTYVTTISRDVDKQKQAQLTDAVLLLADGGANMGKVFASAEQKIPSFTLTPVKGNSLAKGERCGPFTYDPSKDAGTVPLSAVASGLYELDAVDESGEKTGASCWIYLVPSGKYQTASKLWSDMVQDLKKTQTIRKTRTSQTSTAGKSSSLGTEYDTTFKHAGLKAIADMSK